MTLTEEIKSNESLAGNKKKGDRKLGNNDGKMWKNMRK